MTAVSTVKVMQVSLLVQHLFLQKIISINTLLVLLDFSPNP